MSAASGTLPRVSVVMPVRDEARTLGASLGAVLAQDYPQERLEVLVADGRSRDGTRALVERLAERHPNLRLLDNPGRIVSTGLNRAIREARGEVVVRVDGHTEIAPDYVRRCVEALRRTGADNVGGRMAAVAYTPVGRAIARATSSPFGVGGARFHYFEGEAWVDTVYLGAWPRAVFERIGLFDEDLVRDQDDELNYRLRARGGRIFLSPEIRSRYSGRASLRALWRQYFGYGLWKVRVLQKHPGQMRPRQFVPPVFVLTLLVLGLGAVFGSPVAAALLGLVVFVYLSANLGASLWTARRELGLLPLLPPVFVVLHLAYGAGFLAGLVRFAGRWGDREGRVPALDAEAR